MSSLCDAHLHLQDPRIPNPIEALRQAKDVGVRWMVVNGVQPEDWDAVLELSRIDPAVVPSIGLHPWHIAKTAGSWTKRLEAIAENHPVGIGEVGLDRWMPQPDTEKQEAALRFSIELAIHYRRPLSIHCLRAWGALRAVLEDYAPIETGFLLHAYSGSKEMIAPFSEMGAYFSFSGYFGHERKAKRRAAFERVPRDRLLIETDAPDMLPPENWIERRFPEAPEHHHPANVSAVYQLASTVLKFPIDALTTQVGENFQRLFGPILPPTVSEKGT